MTRTFKYPIRFKFDVEKFITCLAFFADKKLPGLTKLKVCKLLYYVDKHHLIRYGRPVTGDIYYRLDNGPVPSASLNIMDEVISRDEVLTQGEESNSEKLSKYLKIQRFPHKYPLFQLKQNPELENLSESDIESLEQVVNKYGHCSASALIESTHTEAPWQKAAPNTEIDYRLFFESDPDARPEALEYMESMCENTELILGLE